jgi:hypothetical protein
MTAGAKINAHAFNPFAFNPFVLMDEGEFISPH